MNVAHCIHGLGPGGAQKVIATILRGRRDDRLRYFIYSCHSGIQHSELTESGATVRIIPRRLAKFDPLWVAGLARAMRRDGIDLVHTHLFGDSLHGALAARLAGGRPVVMTLHTLPQGLSRLQRRGYRWLLARCARAIACSRSVARGFAEQRLTDRLPETIANGFEPPRRDPLSDEERHALRASFGAGRDTVLFAAVGRLTAAKGFADLLQAFARLADAGSDLDTRLMLVGEGPLRDELEVRARRLGLDERVTFAGFRSDVPELLEAVDIVVFSSRWEGLPVALLEAMAAGRCIVSTDVPGILEAVRDGREALVSPVADVAALTASLLRAAVEPALRARLAEAAKRRFQRRFTAAVMVERYETVYRNLYAEVAPHA